MRSQIVEQTVANEMAVAILTSPDTILCVEIGFNISS